MQNINDKLISYMLNQLSYLQGCFNILEAEETYSQKSVNHVREFVKFTANELLKINTDIQELRGEQDDTLHN